GADATSSPNGIMKRRKAKVILGPWPAVSLAAPILWLAGPATGEKSPDAGSDDQLCGTASAGAGFAVLALGARSGFGFAEDFAAGLVASLATAGFAADFATTLVPGLRPSPIFLARPRRISA